MKNKKPKNIILGLALFSMFFGSGNLIFPLMLGRDAGKLYWVSALGFILSAVIIPAFGVLAIVLAQGNYLSIFSRVLPPKYAKILIFIILLSFIPFGAGPRCVMLAHASLEYFLPMPPLYLFSALFLFITGYIVNDKNHVLDILGKFLTPILLFCVLVMIISAFIHGEIDPPLFSTSEIFTRSLFEGYLTQDLLSSLFFSSSLIILVKNSYKNKQELIINMLKGSSIGIILLGLLYVFLIASAALHSDILLNHTGVKLISILAQHTLGPELGVIASLAVALACLTTAVALTMAFSQFLSSYIFSQKYKNHALYFSVASIYVTSLIKFDGLMSIIYPAMNIIYPVVILVVIKFLYDMSKDKILK